MAVLRFSPTSSASLYHIASFYLLLALTSHIQDTTRVPEYSLLDPFDQTQTKTIHPIRVISFRQSHLLCRPRDSGLFARLSQHYDLQQLLADTAKHHFARLFSKTKCVPITIPRTLADIGGTAVGASAIFQDPTTSQPTIVPLQPFVGNVARSERNSDIRDKCEWGGQRSLP